MNPSNDSAPEMMTKQTSENFASVPGSDQEILFPTRILIAEDNSTSRELLATVLKLMGHEVEAVCTGAAAWEALQKPEAPRLAIIDWMMPEMEGIEVVRRVRTLPTRYPHYFIMLSALGETSNIIAALEAGANEYLVKPFDLNELKARVEVGLRTLRMQDDLVRLNEQLRESEARYRHISELAPVLIWKAGVDVLRGYFNQRWLDFTGRTLEQEMGNGWMESIHPDDFQRCLNTILEAFKTRTKFKMEYRLRRVDGDFRWVIEDGIPRFSRDGNFVGYIGVCVDITARKRAEMERERLSMAIEQAAETVVITDADGRLEYVNPAFEALTGYSENEVLGQKASILKSGVQEEGFYRALWETISRGETWQGTVVNKKKDGSLFTEAVTISPVHDSNGAIINYVAVKRDITYELKLKAQFDQAQKLESIGKLAGGVAHDFNNMLGVILGHTELALEQVDADHPLSEHLQEIRLAAGRSADLTRQLLAFSRQQPITPKVLDLSETIAGMLKMLGRLIGEDIQLAFLPGNNLWPIKLDPSQLDQVLVNLCINARDAIEDVGTITIETDNESFDPAFCATHAGFAQGAFVRLTVSDTGCGMDKETMAQIFEPFFTTKDVGKGTGLGLATVLGIVNQNGGVTQVQSEPGQGTKFTIYFARHLSQEGDTPPGEHQALRPRGQETILLVEDEPAILNITKDLLERQGYTVLAAATSAMAIRLAEECGDKVQLLLTDLIMPEMNGRELANNLQARLPHLRVLFMSGYTASVIAHHGVLDENVCFIQKPFSIQDLAVSVRKALDRRPDTP